VTASPLFDVSGRLALVTGSTRGIGRALAEGLVRAGCDVAVNGRSAEAAERVAAELGALGPGTAHACAFDVTDSAAVDAAVAALEEGVAPIDVLVNNTGMQQRKPFTEFSDDEWQRLLDVNLTSAFTVARAVARRMVPRGRGKVVNVLSVQSEVVRPGIQVNGLGPGYFATELTAALVADEEFTAWVSGRTPAGRWGDVAELVGPLLFLCSDASGFVNGQTLHVDGGMLAVL
jgi:gluconate 5-dehydrogenase